MLLLSFLLTLAVLMINPQQSECLSWNLPRMNSPESVSLSQTLSQNGKNLRGQRDALVKNLLKQEALMDEAKNSRTLVKRFIGFLRMAYPLEMREFSAAVHPRKRRSWRGARVASLFKTRRLGCKVTTSTCKPLDTTRSVCTCKTPCDPLIVDTEEPDKYKLFFSNPPLCRPTTTVHPLDVLPTTDMCGHSCDCHTEAPTTDNDKEIFVGVPSTKGWDSIGDPSKPSRTM
ncbi:hypothetical protein GE061_002692 [Apolygus lucorum]|uniref:TGF-beta family profile domain-containing protein n=1 Tax=Apolygus lucorum TaxID=248454 RepID=A0A8S9X7P8_APOLU|nr:hypothetical protein GE061_002692 [Apolygus lucorum]